MTLTTAIAALGFEKARLNYALRTAVAACLAIWLARIMGFEHPQWSGMTVWAASQPMRGNLLEKSLFRILGTLVGALYGIGLLVLLDGLPWAILAALSLWLACCAAAGNLLRGFASYGAILAGYSAAMVALLHSTASAGPFAVGLDRVATVLLGVVVALAIGWAFASADNLDDPYLRVRQLLGRTLSAVADHLMGGAPPARREQHRLLAQIADLEDGLDGRAAGSLRARVIVRSLRRMLFAQVALLLWVRRPPGVEISSPAIASLRRAAQACNEAAQSGLVEAELNAALEQVSDEELRETLTDLNVALASYRQANRGELHPGKAWRPLPLHLDWVGAAQAWARAGCVTFLVGAIWLTTGWDAGAFMLLGICIMMTIFSTSENPASVLRYVVVGQTLGILGALCCRWFVWPMAQSEAGLILSLMPFVLAGGVLMGHRKGAGPIGFDYNMVLLLLLQPHWPLTGTFAHALQLSAAVVLGPIIAIAAYLCIFPVSAHRKLQSLFAMMVCEVAAMAGRPGSAGRRAVWRARLYHRVLRLVRWSDRGGIDTDRTIERAFTVLLVGSATLHLDALRSRADLPARPRRVLGIALARLGELGKQPERAARTLALVARRLPCLGTMDRVLLEEAAAGLTAHAPAMRTGTMTRHR